jgi:hypothetical protein
VAPLQSPSPAHGVHVPLLQMGVFPPQSFLLRHTTHESLLVLQRGALGGHSLSLAQPTHSPWKALLADVSQYGVEPLQSLSLEHARHACVVVLQMGVAPPQSVLAIQPTHVDVAVLQTGVAPVQAVAFVAEQMAQMPFGPHAGVPAAPLHSESPPHEHGMPSVLSSSV